jgi:hypothetical protein
MGEQALGDGRGLRHAGLMPAIARRRIEEYQSGGNACGISPTAPARHFETAEQLGLILI